MAYFVYILFSESLNVFYKGQTKDLDNRILRHNMKLEKSTSGGAPWKLIWHTEKQSRAAAVILERKLKNLSKKRLTEFILKHTQTDASPDDPD
jgi:putative endonuclease